MLYRFAITILATSCFYLLLSVATAETAEPRRIFNDDAQFLFELPAEKPVEFIQQWLDREIAAVPFSTFVFLAATPDICTFESKAGEVSGDRFPPGEGGHWVNGIRHLRAVGTDALEVVTQHMHAKGKEVLAAVRMSDTHHSSLDPANPLCPQFAIDNPQFVIKQPDGRSNETALDYSYAEVRAHRLAIMREIVEKYDVDGLELNFVRWAKHFPRDQGREKAVIMTRYMGEISRMLADVADRKGRKPFTLGVRVAESVDACWLAGADIESWVENNWIDYIVVSTWNNTDPQLRVDQFSRITRRKNVDVIVVMGNMMGCIDAGPPMILDRPVAMSAKHAANYQGMLLTASEARGAAANFFAWGADSISFWNVGIHFGSEPTAALEQQQRIAEWTKAVSSLESIYAGPRTYRYLPMGKGISDRKPPIRNYPWYDEGHSPLGHRNSPIISFAEDAVGRRQAFPFLMADGRKGESLEGTLTFWVYALDHPSQLSVDINGEAIAADKIRTVRAGERRGGLAGWRFELKLADCPEFRGENQLGLTLTRVNSRDHVPYIEELEVVVTEVLKRRRAAVNDSIRIMIAVDSEGPTGVDEYWARNRSADDPRVMHYRLLLTHDVNAAVEGCFKAGATEVFVRDDGFRDRNLVLEHLDKRAQLVSGHAHLLQGLDSSFDGVMLVGLHAMEGTQRAVLAHTWSSSRRRQYWFNGTPGGEIAAYAIAAAHRHKVPILLVTGCSGTCREATELLGRSVITVAVKEAKRDGDVRLYPAETTYPAIVAGAARAIRQINRARPFEVEFPLHVRLELKDQETTDGYIQWRRENKPDWPGRRAGANVIEAELEDILHLVL